MIKYAVLSASLAINVCIGGLYAWSAFVPSLREAHGLSTAETQIVFGCMIAAFTLAMIFAGRLLERLGPVVTAGAGGILFGAGYVISSTSGGAFPVLLAGIGILAGTGTGFCYVCPLTLGVRWFPARKGLITGLSVAAFGIGAVLLSAVAGMLFSRGLDVLYVFRWTGVAYGFLIVSAASVLRFPAAPAAAGHQLRTDLPVRQLLRDRFFLCLWCGMFCGTFAGLLTIGNLKPLALSKGIPQTVAVAAISAFAIGNAAGRLFWGWVADRIGARAIPLSLFCLAASLGFLWLTASSRVFLLVASFLVAAGFGACFVIYAAQVGSRYGTKAFGRVYPLVFLAYGLSGIAGPPAGGWLYDAAGSYDPAIGASIATVLSGLIVCRRLMREDGATNRSPAG
ncbi:MAG: MFS transporter [Planctomycetota bacterium]|nr:MFS transporter [Planctomycetota bacterium]